MKKINFIALGIIGLTISCSNPDKEYIGKIKQQVKEDAMGIEMNYENINFQWSDTLFVKERLGEFQENYENRLNTVLGLEYYVQDNFEKGKIFSKKYLTKKRVAELRNWEKNIRGIPFNKDYKDYYKYAFAKRDASNWLSELCDQIEETDSLLGKYKSIEEGNLQLIGNILWYYDRIDSYKSNNKPNVIWNKVSTELGELKEIKTEIDSLSLLNPDKVIYYKALNTYKINNPILNGAEQELKKYFLFDDQSNITGKENFKK